MIDLLTFPFRWLDWFMIPPILHQFEARGRMMTDLGRAQSSAEVEAIMERERRGEYVAMPPKLRMKGIAA